MPHRGCGRKDAYVARVFKAVLGELGRLRTRDLRDPWIALTMSVMKDGG
jgi:hypothetical protein